MVFCNKYLCEPFEGELDCHNPYFNRWFSAIKMDYKIVQIYKCHNPYFNRWFSAIWFYSNQSGLYQASQSLF